MSAKRSQRRGGRQKTREELETKRNNVIQELIATERSYVEKLRALIDIYAVPLRSAARSANNSLIPAYDAHVIFGNIERVSEVNERFLGDLEAWQKGEMDPKETIGSLCRDHFVDFHVYKRYINGYQHALESSRELEAKNPLYAAFLQKAREREECKKLGISDLLIMPVQRIPRYTLLLTDLLKVTPEDDPDAQRIQLALERVNEIGQLAGNRIAESVAELHHIHTTIEGCPPNLISASRAFIGAVDASEI
ncbi:Dbl homology domain-containing protein, partial [Martensiomyces pterosporus]